MRRSARRYAPGHARPCSKALPKWPSDWNLAYRGKDYATNVLTFAYGVGEGAPDGSSPAVLSGDMVLCVPVIQREAAEQGKALDAHFAHMIVHGMLHLQGYDHEEAQAADVMEGKETDILGKLGYSNPYA